MLSVYIIAYCVMLPQSLLRYGLQSHYDMIPMMRAGNLRALSLLSA